MHSTALRAAHPPRRAHFVLLRRALLPAAFVLSAAFTSAQTAPAADAVPTDPDILKLDEFVVTAAVRPGTTVHRSSVSLSTISSERLDTSGARSTAELFRNIPGIRSEATSGDGNANITVRGMPLSTGGSQYVQLHEDGLPVLEFGDIAFATADGFLRADYSLANIESVRGGSASTLASNSPGGIINFISKTGETAGGTFGYTHGLGFDTDRIDLAYGSPINDTLRFHVGAFYRTGEGPRDAGYNANNGGQLKLNVTKQFDRGYVRLYFKHLDDRVITYMPMPTRVTGSNSDPSIGSLPGFDVKTDTPHSSYFQTALGMGGDGNPVVTDITDGIHSVSTSIGAEISFDLGDGWTLTDRVGFSANDGRFTAPFPAQVDAAQTVADSIGGAGSTLHYANGPSAGQAIADPAALNGNGMLMRVHLFNTDLKNFDYAANNLKLDKTFELAGDSTINVAFGYYKARQNIEMDWLWNTYLLEVKGDNAALVDVRDAAGNLVTENGLVAYGVPAWGWLGRGYDAVYDIDAPFATASYQLGKLNVDASVRRDSGEASGSYFNSVQLPGYDMNRDGVISAPEALGVTAIDRANPLPINYDWSYVSYSFGANYAFTDKVAAFTRYSKGGRARADRLLFTSDITSAGSLAVSDVAENVAKQFELGVKYRTTKLIPGNLALFATFFSSETTESNSEAAVGGPALIKRVYEAHGIELEAAYQLGGFDLRAGVTWTDAEITGGNDPTVIGHTPRRQADLIFNVSPSYTWNRFSLGANVIGTTKSYTQDSNQLVMPAYAYVNAFASYQITKGLTLSVTANNLFDEFGLSEAEDAAIPASGVIEARGITGRTVTAAIKYTF